MAGPPQPPPPLPPNTTRVLFCGRDMHYGFAYTAEALADAPAIECVQCDRDDAAAWLPTARLAVPLMCRLDAGMLEAGAAGRLTHVLQYGVGVEGVDLRAAAANAVAVHNIPSDAVPNAVSCAEMAIFLALAVLRRLPELQASLAARTLGAPPGRTLTGKTALVIGFGNIARQLVPRLAALGVMVDAVRRSPWPENGEGAAAALRRRGAWGDLHAFAASADLIFLACAHNEGTAGVVGAEFWRAAKRGAALVNIARGGLVDPDAALEALTSGAAGGLGLDVTWEEPVDPCHPLALHPRVVLTPHVAGVTQESYRGMAEIVAAAARRLAGGEEPEAPRVV